MQVLPTPDASAPTAAVAGPDSRRRASEVAAEYRANAYKCLALADRYSGASTEATLRAAAKSWFLLAELEVRAGCLGRAEPYGTAA
jgi:hypothetical protein